MQVEKERLAPFEPEEMPDRRGTSRYRNLVVSGRRADEEKREDGCGDGESDRYWAACEGTEAARPTVSASREISFNRSPRRSFVLRTMLVTLMRTETGFRSRSPVGNASSKPR